MIKSIHIENYKCFKDFDIEDLGPFNVLVGPNDSGKTALLEAILLSTGSWRKRPKLEFAILGTDLGLSLGAHTFWRNVPEPGIRIDLAAEKQDKEPFWEPQLTVQSEGSNHLCRSARRFPEGTDRSDLHEGGEGAFEDLLDRIGRANYYRFDPRAMKKPSPFEMELAQTGEGLPTFLDDLPRHPGSGFADLQADFRKRFPHYESFRVDKAKAAGGGPGFVLSFFTVHGEKLPPDAVSDGVLVSLAFLSLSHAPSPPGILLIEEPENGVHFASLKDIVDTLRHLCRDKGVQVFVTTHSPYLLDLAELNEVWVFNKDEEGAVHARNLADLPETQDMRKHFMTGEIWTGLGQPKVPTGSSDQR